MGVLAPRQRRPALGNPPGRAAVRGAAVLRRLADGFGLVLRSTATSWRRTSSLMSLEAGVRLSRSSQPTRQVSLITVALVIARAVNILK
jgi:hypothetical protein